MTLLQTMEETLTFEVAKTREDLEAAFSLLYHSYLRAGLVTPSDYEMRVTPYHLLPTTEVVVTKCRETVVSTISLFADGELGLPMEAMYPQEVDRLRNRGLRIAEVGSLADRRKDRARFLDTFFQMTRVLAQTARIRGIDALVAAVHPRHAKFYSKLLGFQEIGDLVACPYVQNRPAVALCLNFEESRSNRHFHQYFGDPLPIDDLEGYRLNEMDRSYLADYVDCNMLPVDSQ